MPIFVASKHSENHLTNVIIINEILDTLPLTPGTRQGYTSPAVRLSILMTVLDSVHCNIKK
jgi:hypothetical protein